MFFAYLFQQVEKLGHALADYLGVAAYVHEVGVTVPSRYDMDMQMARQARPGAAAEVHPDVEAVRFYRQQQSLLRFPDELCHLQQLFVGCTAEVGSVSIRGYQQVAVVVWEAIQHYDALVRSPKHHVFDVGLRVAQVVTDKTFVCFHCAVFSVLRFLDETLNIFDSPRRPKVFSFHKYIFRLPDSIFQECH